jgi:XTP/dITP diphosphohydrolase
MEKPSLFFGTGNAKKLKEIREILGDRFTIKSFTDLPSPLEVEETESTLEGNAALKAQAFFDCVGIPCISDDTGLEVEALDGAPGVFSARYAGPEGDAQANMAKLLHEMAGLSIRKAKFRTVIAYYDGKKMSFFEGELKGSIGHEPRGTNGFGYDPVFLPEGENRTLAEFTAEEKNAISHRGRALNQFVGFLS